MKTSNLFLMFAFVALVSCKKDKEAQPENICQLSKIMRGTGEVDAEYVYNTKNKVVTVNYPTGGSADKPGSTLTLSYDANGKLSDGRHTYNDPMNTPVRYTFNSAGFVTQVKGENPDAYTLATHEYNAGMQVTKSELFSKLSAASPLKHIASFSYEYRNNNVEKVNSTVYGRGMTQTDTVYSTTLYEYDTSKNPFYEIRYFSPSESNSSINNPVKATITNTNADGSVTDNSQLVFTYQYNEKQLPTQVVRTLVGNASATSTNKYDYSCK